MVTALNNYTRGYMAIPFILACRKHGLFEILSLEKSFSFTDLAKEMHANSGFLRVAMNTLESLNWVSRNSKDEYLLNLESDFHQKIPGDIVKLMTFPMNDYFYKNQRKYRLKKWIELSGNRWEISNPRIADLMDGVLALPLLFALKENNLLDSTGNQNEPLFSKLNPAACEEILEFLTNQGLVALNNGEPVFTDNGKFISNRILTSAVVSYTPILVNISKAIFGDYKSVFEHANALNAKMTPYIIENGLELEQYSSDLEEIIMLIFNLKPVAEQPEYIANIGCGDGALLRKIYDIVQTKSLRGQMLSEHPIKLIGIDSDDKALGKTVHTLHGLEHIVMQSDAGNPDQLATDLKNAGIQDVENILYISSFASKNHIGVMQFPSYTENVQSNIHGETVYIDREGNEITLSTFMKSLVNDFRKCSRAVNRHGLILLEEHHLHPKTVNQYIDNLRDPLYNAFHGFPQHFPVEADKYIMAAAEAGLFPKPDFFKKYPKLLPFTRSTLNYFESRDYSVRYASEKDLPALEVLEKQCWESGLQASVPILKERLKKYPEGQLVLEKDGKVLGVIYSQRIVDINHIHSTTMGNVEQLHVYEGPVVQLLAINILPEMQHRNWGGQLLEFMLQCCTLMSGVHTVIGITRCKDYPRYSHVAIEEYIRLRNEYGRPVDTILNLHEIHGAQIKGLIPNYRSNDTKNKGYGVLVEYDILNRQRSIIGVSNTLIEGMTTAAAAKNESVQDYLVKTVINILGKTKEDMFSIKRPLMEMGLNSTDLLELLERIVHQYNVSLKPTFFFEYNTVDSIIQFLEKQLSPKKDKAVSIKETDISLGKRSLGDVIACDTLAASAHCDDQKMGIAITGIACRLPGGIVNKEQLWNLLASGKDAIRKMPSKRWNWPEYIDPDNAHKGIDCGGFLDDIASFDAAFFRMSPKEAELTDPQQRILLELSWECLEDAGYPASVLFGSKTGVFIGASGSDYNKLLDRHLEEIEAYYSTGTSMAVLPNRISYFYNLHGPSIQIDTACSSSLVAIYEAVRSLQAGECGLAFVGGINIMCYPSNSIAFYQAGMLAKDGRCKTFDKEANGYVRGEGTVMLLLKPLEQALMDKDTIYAVIKGTAINHGGQASGLTVPNPAKQSALLTEVYQAAGIESETVGYIEAHGTGTSLGDPIEISGLTEAFYQLSKTKKEVSEPYCGLGSIKTNIGHLEAAAGIAGLLKVLLSLQHQTIPASLNFNELNPHITLVNTPFYIVNKNQPWLLPDGQLLRRAGVSSFGSGGSNAHVVLEEAPVMTRNFESKFPGCIICLSAQTEEALRQKQVDLALWLEKEGRGRNLAEISATLLLGREHFGIRAAYVVNDMLDLHSRLQEVLLKGKSEKYFKESAIQKKLIQPIFEELGRTLLRELYEGKQLTEDEYKNKLMVLAELFVKGYELDWKAMYGDKKIPRLSLPVYPFARERYWVPERTANSRRNAGTVVPTLIHPILHRNTSDLSEQRFSSTFTGHEFFLLDHVVKGQKVLPGAACLEMVRAAVAQAAGSLYEQRIGINLKNVAWVRPIVAEDEPVHVHIRLVPEDDGDISYEIYSDTGPDNTEPLVHVQGSAMLTSVGEIPALDLPAIQERCSRKILSGGQCYKVFRSVGLDYGPGHQGIEKVYQGEGQVLAKLSLPSSVSGTINQFVLHPGILDSAIQVSLLMGSDNLKLALPYALQEIQILGSCTSVMWAFIRYSDGSSTGEKVQKLDIDLCDEEGHVCVRMKEFSSRTLEGKAGSFELAKGFGTLMVQPYWKEQAVSGENSVALYSRHLVILCELGDVSPEIIAAQMNGARCISLQSKHKGIEERFLEYAAQTFEEIQSILKNKPGTNVLIQVLVSGGDEQQPFNGLAGLLKTARLENPKIIGQLIETAPGEDDRAVLDKLQDNSRSPFDSYVRYRNGKRYVSNWSEVEVSHETASILWKDRGTYLITGGAGGLGLVFANEIVHQVKDATLILTGRSPLNKDKQDRLKELETLSARIEYRQVDVTREKEVAYLIQSIQEDFRGLDGIIHSAGVIHDNFIIKKTKDELLEVLAPKVTGLVNLDQASSDLRLDFFILFSSIAGSLGNPGQADYAAANAFMDSYARFRNVLVKSNQRHGRTISINWPLWKEGGMHVDEETESIMNQSTGMNAMNTSTGIKAFYQSIASGQEQIMVMEGSVGRMRQVLQLTTAPTDRELLRVDTKTKINNSGLPDKILADFIQVASKLLGVKTGEINADIDLTEYGFDLPLLTEFTNTINQEYNLELTPGVLLEYKTLHSIVESIIEEERDTPVKSFQAKSLPIPSTKEENNQVTIPSKNALQEKAENYFKKLLSSTIKLPSHRIEADAPLDKYGIDSIMANKMTNELEKTFGSLSKTLFFEYQNIREVAAYFIGYHCDQLITLLGIDEKAAAATGNPKQLLSATAPGKPALPERRRLLLPQISKESQPEKIPDVLDIAVIGVSGRYPGAENIEKFWENLREGRDCITEVPTDRWDHSLYFNEEKNKPRKTNCKWGGFLKDIDLFDPLFFNISPSEAEVIDPMDRLFLETVWNLLEDSGYTREMLQRQYQARVGVYVGAMYQQYHSFNSDIAKESAVTVSSYSSIANRVSHFFNFQGPSIAIDTMCSSATIAVHMACESLARGDCKMAVAGGVNLSIHPKKYLGLSRMQMLGSHMNSRSFGDGDGYLPSEGVGAVLLKPLSKAVEEGDSILAVIKSSATNHGGHTNGFTVPNPNAQAQLIEDNFRKSGIHPRTISYVEAAANGSALGDTIEIVALNKAFKQFTGDQQFCAIGSVKSNIGHPEAVSGMAQLTKVILQLQHKQLVPSIKADPLNPNITLDDTPFYLNRELRVWNQPVVNIDEKEQAFPRRATINSFGAGGSNAHLILEEYTAPRRTTANVSSETTPQVVLFSARNRAGLLEVARQMIDFAEHQKGFSLRDFAYTLQIGREAMETRLAMVVNNRDELIQGLRQYLNSISEGKEIENIIPIFCGDLVAEDSDIKSLLSGKAWDTVLKVLMADKDIEKLGLFWAKGGNMNWELLHEGETVRKMSIPTYPFDRKRYWISLVNEQYSAGTGQADLLDKPDHPIVSNDLDFIKKKIGEILGIPDEELPEQTPLLRLGFNSIQAVTLKYMLEHDSGIEIPVAVIGQSKTITELIKNIRGIIKTQNSQDYFFPEIVANTPDRFEPFPLNDIQESFLTGRTLRFGGDWVGCHIYFELEVNDLDIYRLNNAWERLISYHEMLRSVILPDGQQKILEQTPPYRFKVADLRIKSNNERTEYLENVRASISHNVYKPEQWPLFEIRVSVCPDKKYIIHFSIDEFILDASGLFMLLQQWKQLYENPQGKLPDLSVSFRDYVLAVKKLEGSKRFNRDLEYWTEKLKDLPEQGISLPLPERLGGPEGKNTFFRTRLNGTLEKRQWDVLKNKADQLNVSATALLLSIFAEVLRSWSDNETFPLILTYFNRLPLHPQLDQILGPFISTQIFTVEEEMGRSFKELMNHNQQRLWSDLDHTSVSGIRALRELKERHKISRFLYLPVVFTSLLNNFETKESANGTSFFNHISFMVTQTPQVYLDHQVFEQDGILKFSWDVAEDYFPPYVIREMFSDYCRTLDILSLEDSRWEFETLASGIKGRKSDSSKGGKFKPFPLTDQQQAYAFGRFMLRENNGCQLYQEFEALELDIGRLEKAWLKMMETHEMLITVIGSDGTQRILQEIPNFKIKVADLTGKKADEVQFELDKTKYLMVEHVFELDKWPYFDLCVSIIDGSKSRIHFSMDMIVCDANSIFFLLNQLFYYYDNPFEEPKKVGALFRDYVLSLQKYQGTEGYQTSIQYWENKFMNIPPGPQLPMINGKERTFSFEHTQLKGVLSNWEVVKEVAGDLSVSPGMILLTAYTEVFSAWLDHTPFTIVVPCWERLSLHPDIDDLVGDFTAMSWLATSRENKTFVDKVRLNHSIVQSDLSHRAVSGLKILRKVMMKGGYQGAFTLPVVFTNMMTHSVESPTFKKLEMVSKTPHVYLDNISEERNGHLHIYWDTVKGIYPEDMIEEMFSGYIRVLEALAKDPKNWNQKDFTNLVNARPEKYKDYIDNVRGVYKDGR